MSSPDVALRETATETDPVVTHEAKGETYTLRRYRPEDRQPFFDLHDAIGMIPHDGGTEWFDWKFVDNPYLAHTPLFVAEREDTGEIVGVRPFMAFRLRAGPRTAIGLQTADTGVHPDHQSRGLFARMNELAFEYYRQREPEVMFSIPNNLSRPGYLKGGAKTVSPIRSHLRIESPSQFIDQKLGSWVPSQTGSVLDGLASGYLGFRDRQHNGDASKQITVDRHATVPSETLAALGTSQIPSEIHAVRDRRFYDWRFENPNWEYDAFVANRDGEPFAAMVAGTREHGGRVLTRIVDAVPLAGEDRLPGFAAILSRLLEVRGDSDVFALAGTGVPSKLLRQFGFQPNDELPLSPVSNQTILITMPLQRTSTENEWVIEGRDVTDPTNWQLPFCEQNTA